MSKVLVVDDVAGLRQHVSRLLNERLPGPMEVIEAQDGKSGIALALSENPDLIVMDISMPDITGIEAAEKIWSANKAAKILFWSQFHREAYVRELAQILPDEAIHGYALKSESDEKLVYAIESILVHDNPYIDPIVRGVQTRLQQKDKSLSDVEYEALIDVAMGLTDKAIAARRHISVRGVQNRLAMLVAKLLTDDAPLKAAASMEVLNPRMRLVLEGLLRGLVDADQLPRLYKETDDWIFEEYGYERV
jgi:DNA-binding NarL/FixJ family response regulator